MIKTHDISENNLSGNFVYLGKNRWVQTDRNGNWIPACGGTETPFRSRSGKTLLYCWQPSTGRHAYLDCGSDLILSDEEARLALAI